MGESTEDMYFIAETLSLSTAPEFYYTHHRFCSTSGSVNRFGKRYEEYELI